MKISRGKLELETKITVPYLMATSALLKKLRDYGRLVEQPSSLHDHKIIG